MILTRSLLSDSGRRSYHMYYLQMVLDRPVLGYGLVGGWKGPGEYPHHLFIELLLSFGIVFGAIAFTLVIFLSIKSILSNNRYIQRLAIIFVSYCVSLFLSDSFMTCPEFYILIAIGLSSLNVKLRVGDRNGYHPCRIVGSK